LKILLANCTPLSDMSTFGTPYLAIMRSLKAFFRDSAVALRSGTNSVHLENQSVNTSSIWLPCFERGRGPTKSTHTHWFLWHMHQHFPSHLHLIWLESHACLSTSGSGVSVHSWPVIPGCQTCYCVSASYMATVSRRAFGTHIFHVATSLLPAL